MVYAEHQHRLVNSGMVYLRMEWMLYMKDMMEKLYFLKVGPTSPIIYFSHQADLRVLPVLILY